MRKKIKFGILIHVVAKIVNILEVLLYDLGITWDEVTYTKKTVPTKTIPTNFTEKNLTRKTKNLTHLSVNYHSIFVNC